MSAIQETSSLEQASTVKATEVTDPMTVDGKESEPITTTENEADKESSTTQNEEELLAEGSAMIKSKQFDKACNVLSDALRLTQEKGTSTTIGAVDYYIKYGEALLRFAQSSNDIFGAAVRQTQQEHQEEEEEEDDRVEMATDATNTENATSEQNPENTATTNLEDTSQKNGNSKEEQDDDVEDNQPETADGDDEQPESNAPNGLGDGDVDTSEDREIAWETFEYARTIMEEYLAVEGNEKDDQYLTKLATVHSFLGEICLEDERHDAALLEFDAALVLQGKCSEGVVSCRERATNHYWACLAAQCAGQLDVAVKHCATALDVLSDQIQILCSAFETEEECKSHEDVISVAEKLVESLDGEKAESENGKELKSLVGVMAELNETKQEVERMILKQQEEPQKTDANAQGLAMLDESDPLAAMIAGLVQQCGIDQEELAKMEAMEEDNNDENKNNTNNTNQKNQGVTTIGFGNQDPIDEDEPVHELNVVKKRRKRNMEEAGISDDASDEVKKMKLSNGEAKSTEQDKAEDAKTA